MLYIVLQKDVDLQKLQSLIEKKQILKWIYLGEDTRWRICAEKAFFEKTPRISIADTLDSQAWMLRQPYIEWIGKCSCQNDSQGWWASDISSKDPYGLLYLRLCFFAVGRSIITQGLTEKTLIVCSSSALAGELIDFSHSVNQSVEFIPPSEVGNVILRILKFLNKKVTNIAKSLPPVHLGRFFSSRYRQYLEEHPIYRQKILKKMNIFPRNVNNNKAKIMFFTYVDKRNLTADGKYQDPHFGPLPKILKDKGYEIVFVPRILESIPYKEAISRLLKTGETFIFQEFFISNADMQNCQTFSLKYFPNINEETKFVDIPVYNFIKENLIDTRDVFTSNLLIEKFISNMASSGNVPCQIMYTCEGQSWETALIWAIRKYMPDTKIVAYDNVTFSKLTLSMFPAQSEFCIKPLPDIIVTNGPLYSNILMDEGYPPEMVRVGCALRHSYIWEKRENIKNKKRFFFPITLLVVSAAILADSVELITKISNAFGGDMRYNIQIKCHPLVNVQQLKESLGDQIYQPNIIFTDEPVHILLKVSDILFYTYTSVCYEALSFKVPPVCVHLENFLNLDKLDIAPDVRWTATTQNDLQKVVFDILHMTIPQREMWEEKASQVVKDALSPVEMKCIDSFIV